MSEISSTPSRPATPVNAPVEHTPTARPYRFTWDPSSRRPGPESVSGITEGRGADYFNQLTPTPFPLGVLNTSTTSLTLTALPNEWSSSKHGFHAISTVLNHPHKKQAPPKPHSSLPVVPPVDLPRVRRKDFDPYLRAIASEWERFERNVQLGREGQAQLDDSVLQDHTDANLAASSDLTPTKKTPHESSSSSSRRASLITTPVHSRRAIPPLESVPPVFFESGFNLADPSTFAKVTEQPTGISSGGSPSTTTHMDDITDPTTSLSHTPPLLDKFSHYADTVEQHLVREISIRSTSFFAALTNLQDLQSESDVCLDRISKLRGLLKEVDEKTAKKGLEVVKRSRKVAHVLKVKDVLRGVGRVVEMTGLAKGLVGAGQWGGALDVVEELERLWEGERVVSIKEEDNWRVNNDTVNKLETMLEEDVENDDNGGQDTQEQRQQPQPTLGFPLSTLTAFSELPNHLRALTLEIATSLSQEVVVVLKHDLEECVSRAHSTYDTKVNTNGHTYGNERNEGLRDRLKPLLQNLVRTRGLKDAISDWKKIVLGEVKSLAKKAISGFDKEWEEEEEENRVALVQHLKDMEHPKFVLILQGLYKQLLALIEGVQTQNRIINYLLESIQIPSISGPSPQNIAEDLSDLLSSTTELSHTTSSKLLYARTDLHALLPLPQFLALYFDSMAFVVKCEVICRRMIIGLRGIVVRQASVYLSKFHQGRVEKCARVVLDEMWNQVEVGPEVQGVVDVLVKCAVRDAEELEVGAEGAVFPSLNSGSENGTKIVNGKENGVSPSASPRLDSSLRLRVLPQTKTYAELSETATAPTPNSKEPNKPAGHTKGNTKHLKIEDRSYFIVSATAETLVLLIDYLKIVVNLSTLTKDTISKVVEFLMTFNSRTCQLVLGAGAMRSAGLRHITAKHLALASQSLSVVSELIPYVRETFRRHLNQAEAVLLVDFDKLKRDYQVHQTEIHAKLVSIMGDRLTAHIESLNAIDWNQSNGGGVNAYMQTLVKETTTLHKVLSRYLSAAVVEYVMSEVFAGINHRLSEAYGKIELPNQDAKLRLLSDAKFLREELSGLKNVNAPMGMLETVVSEKQYSRAQVPPPLPAPVSAQVPTLTRSNTLTANQRLKGLLSRSSTSVNNTNKALPIPENTSASPRTSMSTPPPPPLPAKAPSATFTQYPLASASTLAFSSEASSASNLTLNVLSPSIPDRVLSASPPPIDGIGAENENQEHGTLSASHQNGYGEQNGREEEKTPVVSPSAGLVEHPLPEVPSTGQVPDTTI